LPPPGTLTGRSAFLAAFLALLAAALMLIHPFTPGDRRSWTAIAYSAKAVAFGTAFIAGSNACASAEWCAASRSSWSAALTLASMLSLTIRCVVGFALLAAASFAASQASTLVEARLRTALPSKPCAAPIARNLAVFAVNGVVVSLGVPAALTYAGL